MFKLSYSTPFTHFLCLVFVCQPFHLCFILKHSPTLSLSVFSTLFVAAHFSLTSLSPVNIVCIAAHPFILLCPLCGRLQTQYVCYALHPVSKKDGILGADVPCRLQSVGSNMLLWPGLLLDRWLTQSISWSCFALILIRRPLAYGQS